MPNTTDIVSLNLAHGEVYSIQHYVIKFVSDLRQFSCFHQVLRIPPPIKLTATIREFNKGRHPAICHRFKRVKSPVRLLETKIFFHLIKEIYNIYSLFHLKDFLNPQLYRKQCISGLIAMHLWLFVRGYLILGGWNEFIRIYHWSVSILHLAYYHLMFG